MNKLNFVQKLPIGFRFEPTDEEIVFQYLVRKVFSYPLPSLIIPEILFNIFSLHPSQLPMPAGTDSDQDRYFFSKNYGTSCCGTAGYWKPFGSDKQIISSKILLPVLGIKKTLVFYKGASSSTTDWFMNVYHIAFSGNYNRAANCNIQQKTNFQFQGSLIQKENWVLCHMFLKKRSSTAAITSYYDSMEADILISDSDSSNSSDSSSLTDDDDDDDVSSSTSVNDGNLALLD